MTQYSKVQDAPSSFAQTVYKDLAEAYFADDKPWIVGFSGGKDSTCLLQFIYYMLARLEAHDRRKKVYVLASDTRVETPAISMRIKRELQIIAAAADRDGLPISTHLVFPKLNDSFWVNLIGRGYPSPTTRFRWCTDRLKISPVSEFIKSVVDKTGEVVVILGARRDESQTRAQTMAAREIRGQRFRPHSDLAKAWVFTPLEYVTTNEVWTYLLQVPSPWGGDNRSLVALYRQASGGECPLVIDSSTPSCGNSRFGCWTCTVVEHDRSMESLVDSGEQQLEPLLDLREFLKEIRNRPGARLDNRRNGLPAYDRNGNLMLGKGPYTAEVRQTLLSKLLQAQRDSGIPLIEGDELAAIQEIWTADFGATTTVREIWLSAYPEDHMGTGNAPERKKSEEELETDLLRGVCSENGTPFELLLRLRDAEERFRHLKRRHGLPEEMREIMREAAKKP